MIKFLPSVGFVNKQLAKFALWLKQNWHPLSQKFITLDFKATNKKFLLFTLIKSGYNPCIIITNPI